MADVEFSHGMGAYGRDADQQEKPNNSLVTATNIAGAIVSLSLIAGVGVWGYKLMVRDVSGIPVVRAAEGEMRVRPENPGGQLAQHQGLAFGVKFVLAFGAGPLGVLMISWTREATGSFSPLLTGLAVLSLVTVLAVFLLPGESRQAAAEAPAE